ncbi:hypothetical protein CCAL13119_03920 [Campylobacter sp. RM13119]|uniref:hypothetical protein n=1 Tax=Campylobacter californiensis TaxID=1032243 RepID=UPI001472846F|nr:hypothetical protein [Campylobacter sp. RM13119]MBE3606110.1 hypothetical protein [Campylobacter sp. RM13119]
MLLKELITAQNVSQKELNNIAKNIKKYAPNGVLVNIFLVKDINQKETYMIEFIHNPLNIGKRVAKFGNLSVCAYKELANDEFVIRILRSLNKEFINLKKGDSK